MQSAFVIVFGTFSFWALGWAATTYAAPEIERDLRREAQLRLRDAGLADDQVFVDGRDVWVSAELSGDASFQRVRTVLEGLDGIREVRRRTTTQTALVEGAAARLRIGWSETRMTLKGTLSGDADTRQIVGRVQESFPSLSVTDSIEAVPGVVSASWESRIPEVIALARDVLREGDVSLEGLALVVRGTAANENIRTETGERLVAELPGMRIINLIRVPDGAAPVAAALVEVFNGKPITFEERSDRLTAESIALLEQAAVILEEHPEVSVKIEGYDDSTAHPSRAFAVSRVKATVVRDFLIRRGVRPTSLRIRAMGQTELDESDENAGRARARLVVDME